VEQKSDDSYRQRAANVNGRGGGNFRESSLSKGEEKRSEKKASSRKKRTDKKAAICHDIGERSCEKKTSGGEGELAGGVA